MSKHSAPTVDAAADDFMLVAAGCSSAGEPSEAETAAQPIVAGVQAIAEYPEFVAIDAGGRKACSGVLLGPKLVLTAGHCAVEQAATVYATIMSDGQPLLLTAHGHGVPFQYFDDRLDEAAMDVTINDVGVIVIDDQYGINLPSYATIASAPIANGSEVVMVGRVSAGAFTKQGYRGSKHVYDGTSAGFPLAYVSDHEVGEPGDSGGPVFLPGPAPHTVVAVHSRSAGTQSAPRDGDARVDLVRTWVLSFLGGSSNGAPSAPLACQFACADYGYQAGECNQGFYCDGHCVAQTGCH